jgi:hypothetical protein
LSATSSQHHDGERNQQVDAQRAHGRTPSAQEKPPQPGAQSFARAVDGKPRAPRQPFEIGDQRRIERGLARDRQAGHGSAIKCGKGQQVFVGKLAQPAALHRRDDGIQPLPVAFACLAKPIGAQRSRFDRSILRGTFAEPARDHPRLPSRFTVR